MWFFQTALKRAKCDPNGINIKIAIFFQSITKDCPAAGDFAVDPYSLLRLGTLPPNPGLRRILFTLVCSPRLPI